MARRLADDGDGAGVRRSVAELLREAGVDQGAPPRRRRRFIEDDEAADQVASPQAQSPGLDDPQAPVPGPQTDSVSPADGVAEADAVTAAEIVVDDGDRSQMQDGADRTETESDAGRPQEPDDAQLKSRSVLSEEEPTGPPHLPPDPIAPADEVAQAGPDGAPVPADEVVQAGPDGAPVPADESVPAQGAPLERSSAVHWVLAIGEVVLAIAIGVGLSFVFRLLWDIAPYVAAVLAPIVICAVVGIVGLSRKKLGLGAVPLNLLLLILFVTTLLVVVPAALVLSGQ